MSETGDTVTEVQVGLQDLCVQDEKIKALSITAEPVNNEVAVEKLSTTANAEVKSANDDHKSTSAIETKKPSTKVAAGAKSEHVTEKFPTVEELKAKAAAGEDIPRKLVLKLQNKEIIESTDRKVHSGGAAAMAQSIHDKQHHFHEAAAEIGAKLAGDLTKEDSKKLISVETRALGHPSPRDSVSAKVQSLVHKPEITIQKRRKSSVSKDAMPDMQKLQGNISASSTPKNDNSTSKGLNNIEEIIHKPDPIQSPEAKHHFRHSHGSRVFVCREIDVKETPSEKTAEEKTTDA
ncbi:MAG: hypothetical protein M1834_004955 [Cirrosporium novae-zelandiae]|nr:MAG: hypothetical protein M1834_004955 [Cirrosporium novae-zelandiae]